MLNGVIVQGNWKYIFSNQGHLTHQQKIEKTPDQFLTNKYTLETNYSVLFKGTR